LLVKYLSSTRTYSYKNIRVEVPAGVFHPKFFYSTKLLLRYLDGLALKQKSILELGAGSGLIAMYAAQKGAYVTATDINPVAVEYLRKNSIANSVDMQIIHSDMFKNIPAKKFDIIAINPPYYKRSATNYEEHAWYCGKHGEYFQQLFSGLANYTHESSKVMMVLSDACDLMMIETFANRNGFIMKLAYQTKNLVERNYIFQIN
jgi:release factor glutamine methyltransferase